MRGGEYYQNTGHISQIIVMKLVAMYSSMH